MLNNIVYTFQVAGVIVEKVAKQGEKFEQSRASKKYIMVKWESRPTAKQTDKEEDGNVAVHDISFEV